MSIYGAGIALLRSTFTVHPVPSAQSHTHRAWWVALWSPRRRLRCHTRRIPTVRYRRSADGGCVCRCGQPAGGAPQLFLGGYVFLVAPTVSPSAVHTGAVAKWRVGIQELRATRALPLRQPHPLSPSCHSTYESSRDAKARAEIIGARQRRTADRETRSETQFRSCKSVGLRLQWFESTTCHTDQAPLRGGLTCF